NVVDICPVGALTSKDFRFQARVWYLKRSDSVCAFCANGCNIEIFDREGHIFRFRPRYNPEVNDYWMCDAGRVGYRQIQGEGRLIVPQIRSGEEFREASWKAAFDAFASGLRACDGAVGGIVSAFATNEEAFLFQRLVQSVAPPGATVPIAGHAWSPADGYSDDLLIKADKNPNRRGLEALGIPTDAHAVEGILEDVRAGRLKGLIVFGADLVGELGREKVEPALEALSFLGLIDLRRSETSLYADVLLPSSSFAETDGTFTNHAGRVQRIWQAFPPPGQAMEGWKLLVTALELAGEKWPSAENVFASLAAESSAFSGLSYQSLGAAGAPLASTT
ncbi:MAG: molybdopterin-dependent oxidoreductase, partial [Candidatus Binatia bacterium]